MGMTRKEAADQLQAALDEMQQARQVFRNNFEEQKPEKINDIITTINTRIKDLNDNNSSATLNESKLPESENSTQTMIDSLKTHAQNYLLRRNAFVVDQSINAMTNLSDLSLVSKLNNIAQINDGDKGQQVTNITREVLHPAPDEKTPDTHPLISDDHAEKLISSAREKLKTLIQTAAEAKIATYDFNKYASLIGFHEKSSEEAKNLVVSKKTTFALDTVPDDALKNPNIIDNPDFFKHIVEQHLTQLANTTNAAIPSQLQLAIDALQTPRDNQMIDDVLAALQRPSDAAAITSNLERYKNNLGLKDSTGNALPQAFIEKGLSDDIKTLIHTKLTEKKNELVIESALEKALPPQTDRLGPTYRDLKQQLWNQPGVKNELINLLQHRMIRPAGADTPLNTQAENLANRLRPLLRDPVNAPEAHADFTAKLAIQFTPPAGGGAAAPQLTALTNALHGATVEERQAQEIKRHVDEFKAELDQITAMYAEAQRLHATAQAAFDATPFGQHQNDIQPELNQTAAALTRLGNLLAEADTAHINANQRLNPAAAAPGAAAPAPVVINATVLADSQAARNNLANAQRLRNAKAELALIKDSRLAKAIEPIKQKINPVIVSNAERTPNGKMELITCQRIADIYQLNYERKVIAENAKSEQEYKILREAITETERFKNRIDTTIASLHPNGTAISDATKAQLHQMKRDFEVLLTEMKHVDGVRNTVAPEAKDRMVRVFPGRNDEDKQTRFTESELEAMHKNPTEYNDWVNNLKNNPSISGINPNSGPHATIQSIRDPKAPQFAASPGYTNGVVHRVFPAELKEISENQMIYAVTERKIEGKNTPDVTVEVFRPAENASDRGALIDFLKKNKIISLADGRSVDMRDHVFKNKDLPTILTEENVLTFLKTLQTGWNVDKNLAREFIKVYLPQHQFNKHTLFSEYMSSFGTISRDEFLQKPDNEKENYMGLQNSLIPPTTVELPTDTYFTSAQTMLNERLAQSMEPFEVTTKDVPLLLAIDCLAKANKIDHLITFPASYQNKRATNEQVEMTKVSPARYRLAALDSLRAVAETKAAATPSAPGADNPADIGEYVSRRRP